MRPLALLAIAIVALTLVACSGGSASKPSPGVTETPVASPTGSTDPRVGAIDVMRTYLRDTGVDGKTGKLADPIDCSDVKGDADFCIIDDASVYAPALVILHVADVDNTKEDVWQVHVNLEDGGWKVTDVEFFGSR